MQNVLQVDKSKRFETLKDTLSPAVSTYFIAKDKCSSLLTLSRNTPRLYPLCVGFLRSLAILLSRQYTQRCKICDLLTDNITVHVLCFCHKNANSRRLLWDALFNEFGYVIFKDLIGLSIVKQCMKIIQLSSENDGISFRHYGIAKCLKNMI